jgi:hypothetical protein
MGSGLADDLTQMIALGRRLRWEQIAVRVEGESAGQDVAWAVYSPQDVGVFRSDVAAMANGGGGYVLVGVPHRYGVAAPRARPPLPLRVGVQAALAWMQHGMSRGAMSPMPAVEWFCASATDRTGITLLRVAPAEDLPVAVAHHRSWTVPFRQGSATVYPNPWDALREIVGRGRRATTTSAGVA